MNYRRARKKERKRRMNEQRHYFPFLINKDDKRSSLVTTFIIRAEEVRLILRAVKLQVENEKDGRNADERDKK